MEVCLLITLALLVLIPFLLILLTLCIPSLFTLVPVFLLSAKGLLLFLLIDYALKPYLFGGIESTIVIVVHLVLLYIYIYINRQIFARAHVLKLNYSWPLQFSLLVHLSVFDAYIFCLWFGKMNLYFSLFFPCQYLTK